MEITILANDTTNLYNHRFEVVQGLVQAGYRIEIIADLQHFQKDFTKIGCKLTQIAFKRHQKNPFNDLILFKTYYKLLKKSKPNCVLTYNIKPNIYGGLACRLLGIKYLTNITGLGTAVEYPGLLQKITTFLYRLAMKKAYTIFFQNTENRAFFEKHKLIGSKTRIVLLPGSGVNLQKHQPLPYPKEETNFLFVARILKEKGIDMYLSAARKFSAKNIKFHIVGPFDSPDYQNKVEQSAKEGFVIYHGQQKDMTPFFKESACLLHPSWYPEGMSNVLLEAAASARPVITTNRAGCCEIVEDGKTGFIVPVQDEQSFLKAIENFLALPWDKKRQMGLVARAKVEKEFDRNLVVKEYLKQIKQLSSHKHIVLFCGTLNLGGAERVISMLAKALLKDYQAEVLLYYNQPIFYSMPENLKITSVEKETGTKNILKNILWMRKFFKQKTDIIISFLAPFNMLALMAHFGLKSKIIVADRNDPRYVPTNPFLRKLRNILYRFADGIVLQTKHNREYFSAKIKSKSAVIYNPIDLGKKRAQALNTPKKDKIVCVGRLMPQKNQKLLLKAFSLIYKKFPKYNIIFYGDGPERSNLEQEAELLGISKNVHFVGSVKNIFDEICDAKLFVLTSNYEGMPNALIEAMCLGLPVISTEVSGVKELIKQGKSGFLVPQNAAEELAEAMQKILSDETLQKKMGEQGVKLNDILQVSDITKQWVDFIIQRRNK